MFFQSLFESNLNNKFFFQEILYYPEIASTSDLVWQLSDDKSKLYFNWLADFREAILQNTQEFRINNVSAEYKADDDLSREITITAGLDYEFQPLENSLFSINLDGLYSSQETYGAQAKLYYKSIF